MRNYEIYEMKEGKGTCVRPGERQGRDREKAAGTKKSERREKKNEQGRLFAEFDRYEIRKKMGKKL